MCQPISGIILKDRILFSESSHSHTDILNEHKIQDDDLSRVNFVRAELVPKNEDMFSDIDTWNFIVDQDIVPEWFMEECERPRMVDAVKEYAKTHIHICKPRFKLATGIHWIKDCNDVILSGDVNVLILENSRVDTMRESSQVGEMWGNSRVGTMWENSQVDTMRESSQVGDMRDSSQVGEMWGNSRVGVFSQKVDINLIDLNNRAVIHDFANDCIYHSGIWTFKTKEAKK